MNDRIPCFTDSDANRFAPEHDEEDILLTPDEQMIEWLCDDWKDALADDTFDTWHSVRMEIYGATQILTRIGRHYAVRQALDDLRKIAFENGIECIRAGRYEGAPA